MTNALQIFTAARLRDMTLRNAGLTLCAADGTRVVNIHYGQWLVEPAGEKVDDAWVAARAEWRVETYGPGGGVNTHVVYLDLDGKGRKLHVAKASKFEVEEYDKNVRAWEKAGRPEGKCPSQPRLHYVEHAGRRYALFPSKWFGVDTAVDWETVGDPSPSRRAEAAKKADRRALSEGAARALAAMVLHVLPDVIEGEHTYYLNAADIWREFTQNRHVFDAMHNDSKTGQWPWEVSFTPEGEDDTLLADAAYSSKLGERLIAGALRRLEAGGWIEEGYRRPWNGRGEYVRGYARASKLLSRRQVEKLTQYGSAAYMAERAADEAEKSIRSRGTGGYGYLSTPEYRALSDAREGVRTARKALSEPFATPDAIPPFEAAVAALARVSNQSGEVA